MTKRFSIEVVDEEYDVEADSEDEAWQLAHQRVEIIVNEIEEEDEGLKEEWEKYLEDKDANVL